MLHYATICHAYERRRRYQIVNPWHNQRASVQIAHRFGFSYISHMLAKWIQTNPTRVQYVHIATINLGTTGIVNLLGSKSILDLFGGVLTSRIY